MTSLPVNEIFLSLQGESTRAGRLCAFVRLAGCNLDCRWCDTPEAASGQGSELSIKKIIEQVKELGAPMVMVTGGEPLIHPGAGELITRLCDDGFETVVETNGTFDLSDFEKRASYIVDVKLAGSGEKETFFAANYSHLRPQDELKFVIVSRADFDEGVAIIHRERLCGKLPLLFSPVEGELRAKTLAGWIIESRLPVRLNLQLHKIIWGRDAKGV